MKLYRINPGKLAAKEVGNLYIPELEFTLTPGVDHDLISIHGEEAVSRAKSLTNAIGMKWVDVLESVPQAAKVSLEDPPAPEKELGMVEGTEAASGADEDATSGTDEEEKSTSDPNAILFDTAVTLGIIEEFEGGYYKLDRPGADGKYWRFNDREHALKRMEKTPEIVDAIKGCMDEE